MQKMKKVIKIFFLLFLAIFLSGCGLFDKSISSIIPKSNIIEKDSTTLKKDKIQETPLDKEWKEIKNNAKLLQCYQSKKDFDQKRSELLPKYKEVINKETSLTKLNIEDQYTKIIYDWLAQESYMMFENIINSKTPNNGDEIVNTKNVLEFAYCPDVSKIPTIYPLTPDGCNELLLSTMMEDLSFNFPAQGNYKTIEEYNLALINFKEKQRTTKEYARKCCYEGENGASCRKLNFWLK